jgi:hypothetical protein
LPTEDVQYVRLRALTEFGQLTLVAAGERRDGTGTIPVDVDVEGWANEQNANIQTLKAFIKPMVASGRLLYVDANDGTQNYADHSTVQDAIDDAVSQSPTLAEQWVILVRPGRYIEDLSFAPFVHVVGWPGDSDGRTAQAVVLEGLHTANWASGRSLLANLHIENNANSSTATLTKDGDGILRTYSVRIESNGAGAGQGPALELAGGDVDCTLSTFGMNQALGFNRVAVAQTGQDTQAVFDNCKMIGPSCLRVNSFTAPVTGTDCTLYNCRLQSVHASGYGIAAIPEILVVDKTYIETVSGTGVTINPTAVAFAGDVKLDVRYSTLDISDIVYDTTNLAGATDLLLGSVIYRSLTFPGTAPTQTATTKSKTNFYDNTISGLSAENVQDAIDEVASLAAIVPVVYHKNIPEVPNDTVRYRGWAPLACELIQVRVYMQTVHTVGNYDLAITNEATGNTVLASNPTSLNALGPATVQPIPLTGVTADLTFATLDRWTIELTSDDPAFDGEAIYVELVFNPATGGGPIVEDLATTLMVGNITGGTDIEVTNSDKIKGQDAPAFSGLDGYDLVLEGGAGDGAGSQGAVRVNGKLTVTGLIDPIGMLYTRDPGTALGALAFADPATGGIFVSDGTYPTAPLDRPVFWPGGKGFNDLIPLIGGQYVTSVVAGGTVTLRASARFADVTVTAAAGVSVFLPPADEMRGVVVYVLHNDSSNAGSTLTVDGDGADTVDGSGSPYAMTFGEVSGFISDGVSNWSILALGGSSDSVSVVHKSVAPIANGTFRYEGWAPAAGTVGAIRVYMESKGTVVGNYTATFTNEATGNSMLSTPSFDMHSGALTAGDPLSLTLTGTPADLVFADEDQWSVEFTSDDPGFDGSGVYFDIVWNAPPPAPVATPAPDDDDQREVVVVPNNTVESLFFAPYDLQVVGINVLASATPTTAGSYTLAVENIDASNNLLSVATYPLTTLAPATLTSLPLTATPVDLELTEGTRVRFQLVSDNGDLGPLNLAMYTQIVFRSLAVSIPDDDSQWEMAVSPSNNVEAIFFAPYNLTVVGIKVYCATGAVTAGTYTLAVADVSGAPVNLLATPTFDMKTPGGGGSLPPATLTSVPLTGIVANLDLPTQTPVRFTLSSSLGDLLAAGVYVQIIYRSQ